MERCGVEVAVLFKFARPGEVVTRAVNDDSIDARRAGHGRAPLPCERPCGQHGRYCVIREHGDYG
eukprot:11204392-Lingulodinium_polyedra.AAC.1